jgi:DNA-binding LytR/AlgR family response regulator
MIRAVAIDDEPQALEIVKIHANKIDSLDLVDTFFNPTEALEYLKNYSVDLIFLDVNMPGLSGIDLIESLRIKPQIIFTTAYEQYAIDSYKYDTIDYLLKPIDFESFSIAVDKLCNKLNSSNVKKSCFIKDGYSTIRLDFEKILFVKSNGNYIEYYTQEKTYMSRNKISNIVDQLPISTFQRIHNTCIVNMECIDKIEHNHVFIGKNKLSISERYKDELNARIQKELI